MIESRGLVAYLARVFRRPVELLGVRPLKDNLGEGSNPKAFGYGVPLEVECLIGGEPRQFVLSRTRPEEGFGHEYPADRAWAALWGHAAFNALPRHVRSLDVGFVRAGGELVSAGDSAEFFQLVEEAEGTPYWLRPGLLLPREAPLASPSGTASASWGSSTAPRIHTRCCRPRRARPWSMQRSSGAGGCAGSPTGWRGSTGASLRGNLSFAGGRVGEAR